MLEATVTKIMAGRKMLVALPGGRTAQCYLSGRMLQNKIKIITGDRVLCEFSLYDLNNGRVTYRYK
jgi:translation initiation factor IF-1